MQWELFWFVCSVQFDGPTSRWFNMVDIASCFVISPSSCVNQPANPRRSYAADGEMSGPYEPCCRNRPHLFCLDEAWFHLSGCVSSHNRFWSAENPALIHEMPLSDIKDGVWCATSATRDNGPIPPPSLLLHQKFTLVCLICILTPFSEHLFDYERACSLWARQSNSPECKKFFQLSPECFWWWNRQFLLVGHVRGLTLPSKHLHWRWSERKHLGCSIFRFTCRTSACNEHFVRVKHICELKKTFSSTFFIYSMWKHNINCNIMT